MIFEIRRLQELTRKKRIPLYVWFIGLTKAYESVDRTLLWTVLARFGVLQIMISVIRQFHDSMRVCVRLDDRVCSRWFAVEQGLRQGCVLAPLLFNIFFAGVINLASARVKADKSLMDALVHLRKKREAWGRGEATVGESVLAMPLWGMLYADDAGVVPQSPEQLRKMIGVMVVVCAAFGLTVSEAKTEVIICLRAKGMPESTATFSVEVAGQVYNQTNKLVYLGKNVDQNADLSIEVDRRVRSAWCHFRKYTLELYDQPSAPLELKIRMLRAEVRETMLYDCVTWSPRHAAPSPPQVLDSLHRLAKAQLRRPPDFLSGHASEDGKCEHRGDFAQEADLVCGICGAHGGYETAEVRDDRRNGGGRGLCWGPGKGVDGVFPGRSQSFRSINADQWTTACSLGQGGMAQNGRT